MLPVCSQSFFFYHLYVVNLIGLAIDIKYQIILPKRLNHCGKSQMIIILIMLEGKATQENW